MRFFSFLFLMILLLSCSGKTTPPATPEPQPRTAVPEPPAAVVEPGAIRMIISLKKNSPGNMNAVSEYCIQGDADKTQESFIYQGLPYRLDGVNVRFPAGTSAELIEKSPALLVTMTKKADLSSALVKTDRTCDPREPPMAQARSDWGTPECGQQSPCVTTLPVLARFSFWEVSAVEAFSGLAVTRAGDDQSLTVKFTNVLSTKQAAQELTAHYEGGSGKPMPRFVKYPVPALEPGASFEVKVQRNVDEDGKPVTRTSARRSRFYDLYYLEMKGALQDGAVELPVKLSVFVYSLFPLTND